jgi:hypothetical protein
MRGVKNHRNMEYSTEEQNKTYPFCRRLPTSRVFPRSQSKGTGLLNENDENGNELSKKPMNKHRKQTTLSKKERKRKEKILRYPSSSLPVSNYIPLYSIAASIGSKTWIQVMIRSSMHFLAYLSFDSNRFFMSQSCLRVVQRRLRSQRHA